MCVCSQALKGSAPSKPFLLRPGLDFLRKWSTDFANPEDSEQMGYDGPLGWRSVAKVSGFFRCFMVEL